MQIVWLVLLALFAAAVTFVLWIGWKVSSMILHPKLYAYDSVLDEEERRGHLTREWFDQTVRLQEFTLKSPLGYNLHCALWPHKEGVSFPDGKPRVVVIVHGYTYALLGGIKYARIFHEFGFDCVLYDNRNHGLSDRVPTTMGYYEWQDLSAVCDWTRAHFGADTVLGTHGESMGASIVMLQAARYPNLAFAVEDCGYSDLKVELKFALRQVFHLPSFGILPIASLFSRLRGGVFFKDVVPSKALQSCKDTPMLFLHGDEDKLVPFSMLQENYAAKPGSKSIRVFPGAGHADCYRSDPEGYCACVKEFLVANKLVPADFNTTNPQ
ncbi:MAG: alpha/beta fold hydrolase [Eubacteriales bacterium]|nr:alpha/beta fold hydrolase [Eubacteriales bacterium]